MRQRGEDQAAFRDILDKIANGNFTRKDYQTLKEKCFDMRSDEAKDKFLFGVGIDPDKENLQDYEFRKRSISPNGNYVWGESRKYRYLINVESRTFVSENVVGYEPGDMDGLNVLGKDAKYARSSGGAQVLLYKLNDKNRIESYTTWKQTGGTGHSATDSSLYNAFANDGDFVKGGTL